MLQCSLKSIDKIVYEAPSFNVFYSYKSIFNRLYEYHHKNGDTARADYYINSIESASNARTIMDKFMNFPNGITQKAQDYLFFH